MKESGKARVHEGIVHCRALGHYGILEAQLSLLQGKAAQDTFLCNFNLFEFKRKVQAPSLSRLDACCPPPPPSKQR